MPRGKRNRYRVNFHVWWGTGSLKSTNERDLTVQEYIARLREVAGQLEQLAVEEELEQLERAEKEQPNAVRK